MKTLATLLLKARGAPQIDLLWEPRDLWVGVYWKRGEQAVHYIPGRVVLEDHLSIYVCLIPCFPIKLLWSQPLKGPQHQERLRAHLAKMEVEMEVEG